MSEQKKPEKKYTAEFRESAVKLAVGSEQPISKTAQELGINKNTLHTWIGKYHIRALTRRTRGRRLDHIIAELRETLLGWKAYFGIAEVLSPLRDIDKWILCPLRCYQWRQWGRAGYRELRKRGVTVREAWNTSKSAHGPWRLSKTPALTLALPARYFSSRGLPALVAR